MTGELLQIAIAIAGCGLVVLNGQQAAPPAIFTDAQAAAGQTAYRAQQPGKTSGSACVDCHTETLLGRRGANGRGVPPLAGADFMAAWGSRTTMDLYARIQLVEPLSEETCLNLVAYILQRNGASSGTQALTRATPVATRSVAGGERGSASAAPLR